ncbi:MAG TPA: hypothetical protein PLF63_06680, partial [Rubrivivax sp.]|nr:hypothetical protein [Rubrivivax sp.]
MERLEKWMGRRGEGYVVAQVFLFALVVFGPRTWPGWAPWATPWTWLGWALGLALGGAGGLLALAGLVNLGRNLTALPHPKDDATLVVAGAYA